MPILRFLLIQAATKLGNDPRVRAKARDLLENEVKPRAAEAWRQARPKLEAARDDLREIAAETDPRDEPRAFAAKVRKRFAKRRGDDHSK